MREAYLFISPLCKRCIHLERIIQKIAVTVGGNLSYHFIPVLNIRIINQHFPQCLRCNLYYKAILDYKAALFQGRKRGQKFFLALQNELINNYHSYDDKLVMTIAENTKLDLDMFKEDRRSPLAKQSFRIDQKLVHEMNIKKPGSVVLFDCQTSRYGILLNKITSQELFNICCPYLKHPNKIIDRNGIPIPSITIHHY